MTSLIQELQAGAINSSSNISELLSKAKVVAVKLNLDEFLQWIEQEMNGYGNKQSVPDYRIMKGEVKGFNPYRGWIPISFNNPKTQEQLSKRGAKQSIGELDYLLKTVSVNNFQMPFPPEIVAELRKSFDDFAPPKITLEISTSEVAGVLNAVRNKILDWALKLEKSGITGDGLSFSSSDQEKAKKVVATYHIESISNFAGVIGSVSEGAIININQINKEHIEELKEIADTLKKYINELKVEPAKKPELELIANSLGEELEKQELEPTKISKLLFSAKAILEGAAGGVIGQGIIATISHFIQ